MFDVVVLVGGLLVSRNGPASNCCNLAAAGNEPRSRGAAPVVLWMYAKSLCEHKKLL